MTVTTEARAMLPVATGGCQCGAVRYAVQGPLPECNLCHCRMCQKASGGPFMVFVAVDSAAVTWTHGTPSLYASSSFATRGFCRDCGTPLTYQYKADRLSLAHGTLDDPTIIAPTVRLSSETVLPWSEHVGRLPIESLEAWAAAASAGPITTYQHPDHA